MKPNYENWMPKGMVAASFAATIIAFSGAIGFLVPTVLLTSSTNITESK